MAFWALVVCTGNRVSSVFSVQGLKVARNGVEVTWGLRKVRSNVTAAYPFRWSEVPPRWILDLWKNFQPPWKCFRAGEPAMIRAGAAGEVQSWLKRWSLNNFGTTSPRALMATILSPRVGRGKMTPLLYEQVMDHTFEVARSHYAPGPADEIEE